MYNSFNLWMFARLEIGQGLEEITVLSVDMQLCCGLHPDLCRQWYVSQNLPCGGQGLSPVL